MKLNWGTWITIFYSSFVLFIGWMVYSAFGENYDLVTEDYYAQEIQYQAKIDSKHRVKQLGEGIQSTIQNDDLVILFPQKENHLEGTIHCFRPSDATKDLIHTFSTENGKVALPLSQLTRGKYLLKVDWVEDNNHYYQEQTLLIP